MSKNKPVKVRPILNRPITFFILLAGSILGGAIVSSLIILIAWQIVKNTTLNADILIGAMGFILLGYPLGNILGIFILKKCLRLEGSLVWSIAASLVGAIGVLGLAELLNISAFMALIVLSVVAPLSGTLGFLLGKRKQKRK